MAARNFNQDMATAAKIVIAEVEEIVETGIIPPDEVHTPSIYVDYLVQSSEDLSNKPIEFLINDTGSNLIVSGPSAEKRLKIASRVAKEFNQGEIVNLGIGIPTLVPAFIPPDLGITMHSENGIIGVDGYPAPGDEHPDLVNASKEPIKIGPGASFFSSSDSFGMVRGGHIDWSILGAMEVSATGDIANWMVPGKMVKGIGGAMDMALGSQVVVAMEHTAKGRFKVVEECGLPLTAKGVAKLLVTDLAVFDFGDEGRLVLRELAEGVSVDDVRSKTGCSFELHSEVGVF